MFVSIGTFSVGLMIGLFLFPYVSELFNFEKRSYDKAIRDHFGCLNNDFTYFFTGEDDYHIVTVKNQEYEVKFSENKPRQIVYSKELEAIVGDMD